MCYLNGKISGSSRNRRTISEPGFHAELRTSAINGSSPDGHYDENSSSEGVEKILEDGFGFKVHNLQDSDSSSSSTCLKEPDFVVTCVARNDEESSSRSDVQVSVIESPEIVPFGFGKEIMNEGEFSQLSCVISKGDEPLISSLRTLFPRSLRFLKDRVFKSRYQSEVDRHVKAIHEKIKGPALRHMSCKIC